MTDDQYQAMLEDKVDPIFDRLKAQCREEKVLRPTGGVWLLPLR